ncbi:MAG: 50S ribosomal protein L4 [Planctomycetales bacterium 12-60-4]|nr:MAG: 50S ribosomal protein L4 [Planctomycetales bacterium 12-60-4]
MISVPIHTAEGQPTGRTYEFDPAELADGVNKQLLHDAVVMYEANNRQGTFKSKSRAEVAGCSKKLYKQKGTGNARAGNKRTPVRRGGGHAFAKRPTDYSYRGLLKTLGIVDRPRPAAVEGAKQPKRPGDESCLLAVDQHDPIVWKSARNIPDVTVSPAFELNAYKLLQRKRLVVTVAALDKLRAQGGGEGA